MPIEHVLMTADAVGGVWTFALDLARAFGARRVRVTLAVVGPAPSDAQLAQARAIPTAACAHHPARLEWMDDPWDDVAAAGEWLTTLARRDPPDLVHLNGYCHATLDWNVPVVVTGHSCVLSWWRAVHGGVAPGAWNEYAARVNHGLRAANLVTAPSVAMLDELDRFYGPLGRTRVIPNGRARARDGAAAPKEPIVLTAGRLWDAAKNVEAVCSIAPLLPWPVCVAGDTRMPGHADAASCEGVRHLGRLAPEEMDAWMARAAIYALPARYEPFGLSALEAAQAGCALVLGDIPSLREIWDDAAIYVPPDDRGMLADSLRTLIADDDFRHAMAARARARAQAFTPDRMADGYLAAYAGL